MSRTVTIALALLLSVAAGPPAGAAGPPTTGGTPPPAAIPGTCEQKLPPVGLGGAANDLLEAARYAQWVLEDIVCKHPDNEEAKKALIKLNIAITKAEGE